MDSVEAYRASVAAGGIPDVRIRDKARAAFLHLGGDPTRPTYSLRDYDHERFGPFLGVSDEGSAAGAIRDAAFESPKGQAAATSATVTPLAAGLGVDAERLGGVGEVAVGPDEYVDIWLSCADRALVTTNIGTRVNLRIYRREPRVVLDGLSTAKVSEAAAQARAAFAPFVETPDRRPRPLTVLIAFHGPAAKASRRRKVAAVRSLATQLGGRPREHTLGIEVHVAAARKGQQQALEAVEIAGLARLPVVAIDGAPRPESRTAVPPAGLLEYFAPGLLGPLLRLAGKRHVELRAANVPDTDTIARSIWVGLATARSMGAHLGKYGCFPLRLEEIDHVVQLVQKWLPDWSAAPVFFVDQGLLSARGIDVENDLPKGIESWLETVHSHAVRVVLIDTIDKGNGRRLLKRPADDLAKRGYLGPGQIRRIEAFARARGIKVLWAGGLGLRDAFWMGGERVFGIYVTTAASETIAVTDGYERDRGLSALKEPTKENVLRVKTVLEAGFLASVLQDSLGGQIRDTANLLLASVEDKDEETLVNAHQVALGALCIRGWQRYWDVRDAAPGSGRA